MTGLLDSGSAVTIINSESHRALQDLVVHKDDCITVVAAGGQSMQSHGYINLPVHFQNQFHIIRAYIVPDINTGLILGVDFWRKFNVLLKFLSTFSKAALAEAHPKPDHPVFIHSYDNLSPSEKSIADNIIAQFENISAERKGLGETNILEHNIDTGDGQPIRQRYYRMSPEKQRLFVEQVDEMLALDVIESCESAWSFPVLIVTKRTASLGFASTVVS